MIHRQLECQHVILSVVALKIYAYEELFQLIGNNRFPVRMTSRQLVFEVLNIDLVSVFDRLSVLLKFNFHTLPHLQLSMGPRHICGQKAR
ncbi:MAG TPA: hypothetical protein VF208_06200 [Candidatus Binatia bacterium]